MAKRSSGDFDLDNTDELPILLEPVEDVAEPFAVARAEDTAEHTELFPAPSPGGPEALLADLLQRAEQIPALEAQIRMLTDGQRDLERRLAEKDRHLAELRSTEAASSQSLAGRLTAELADRNAQIAALSTAVEQLEAAATARSL
jgi:hypothetical protein